MPRGQPQAWMPRGFQCERKQVMIDFIANREPWPSCIPSPRREPGSWSCVLWWGRESHTAIGEPTASGEGGEPLPGPEAGSWEGGVLLPPGPHTGRAAQTHGVQSSTLPHTAAQGLTSGEAALWPNYPFSKSQGSVSPRAHKLSLPSPQVLSHDPRHAPHYPAPTIPPPTPTHHFLSISFGQLNWASGKGKGWMRWEM